MASDGYFEGISPAVIIMFLKNALQKYPHLRQEFEEFAQANHKELEATMDDPESYIKGIADDIQEILESIDPWHPNEGYAVSHDMDYTSEDISPLDIVEDKINGAIRDLYARAIAACLGGRFDKAFFTVIGCYDACIRTRSTAKYDLPLQLMLRALEVNLQKIRDLFRIVPIAEKQRYTIIQVVLRHARSAGIKQRAFFHFFETLLMTLTREKSGALLFRSMINQYSIAMEDLPRLVTQTEDLLYGEAAWEIMGLKLYTEDLYVAEGILLYYSERDKKAFSRIAESLWQKDLFKESFASLYFENLDPETDAALYREVALCLVGLPDEIGSYRKVKKFLDHEELRALRGGKEQDQRYYLQILHAEGRYDEGLRYIGHTASFYNLAEFIRPFLPYEPEESFRIISKAIPAILKTEKNRTVYQEIVEVLEIASSEKELKAPMKKLVSDLYNRRPPLPALKDELRKAGLWHRA